MKTRRIATAVLFALLAATISFPAIADEDAVTLQARTRFKEGVEAFDKGKYEEARLAFLQAYTLKQHPSVLINLAQSSAKANHPLEAAKYFRQFLKEATTANAQQRKDAETGLAEVRQRIGRIDVVAPPGTEISLDDQGNVGSTPMDPLDVEPGHHTVKSPTHSVTVIAVAGQKVEAKLGQTTPTPPAPIASTAPATVLSPLPSQAADTGEVKHTNLLSPPANMTPVYVGLGVAAAGLVSAVVFAAFKSSAQSDADSVANTIRSEANARSIPSQGVCHNASAPEFAKACATLQDNNSKVDTNATIANVSFGVMGAGLVFAGVWYLAAPKSTDAKPSSAAGRPNREPKMTVFSPYATSRGGGFSLSGRF